MRILFVTANRLGDAVLSTGLLAHLADTHREAHGGARITVASGPVAAPLFERAPGVCEVLPIAKRRYGLHWAALWRHCAGTRWDMVVDLRRSALAWCLRAHRRHLIPKAEPLERDGRIHRVRLLAATLGLAEAPAPRLWTNEADRAAAASLVPDGGPVLAIGPAANWRGKTWRAERFSQLAARLTGPEGVMAGARIAVVAAPGERDQAAPVHDALPADRRIDLIGRAPLPVLAAALARATLFVGNDSGLMHMAAAVGTPTLGLFGPSRPEHYAPWGPHTAWVRTQESYETLTGGPGYDHRTTGTLMDGLDVATAEEAAAALWRRSARAAA